MMSAETLSSVRRPGLRGEGSWVQLGTPLCNVYLYAKHWEHSSKLNTVLNFMKLIFSWEYNQGNRRSKETNKAVV